MKDVKAHEIVISAAKGRPDLFHGGSGNLPSGQTFERLPGDASTRRYYRVRTGAESPTSVIVMATEPFGPEGEKWPFLAVQKFLRKIGVDVPDVLGFDAGLGLVVLEDLGDRTLLHHLTGIHSRGDELSLYKRVISDLVNLHRNGTQEKAEPGLPCFKMRFDVEKLMWEVRHTIEHFYLKALQRSIPKADLAAMENGFQAICQELQSEPTVFTHRDFHSRNIMVASKRLVMIDFQDARLGPPQYDLVSLLRDSYYQLPEDEVTQLIDWYLDEWIKSGGSPFDRKRFLRAFDLMTIQRNFKAIGTFASVWNNRSNIGYLKYIGNTFENIRRAMQRYPEFNRLCEGLTHFYYF